MLENVFNIAGDWLLVDELPRLQARQPAIQLVIRLERHASRQLEREFSSQRREHFCGALLAERIETKLGVIALAIPLMRILGTVVHQQEEFRGTDRIGQKV